MGRILRCNVMYMTNAALATQHLPKLLWHFLLSLNIGLDDRIWTTMFQDLNKTSADMKECLYRPAFFCDDMGQYNRPALFSTFHIIA